MAFIKSCSIDSRNEQSPTCEVVHETKLTSEISCPTDSCLAQLVRHWPEDPDVLVSIPTGGNFWRIFFCSSLCKDLLDNLTETPIVKNSIAQCYTFPFWPELRTLRIHEQRWIQKSLTWTWNMFSMMGFGGTNSSPMMQPKQQKHSSWETPTYSAAHFQRQVCSSSVKAKTTFQNWLYLLFV